MTLRGITRPGSARTACSRSPAATSPPRGAGRHYVRHTAQAWGLSPGTTDDLETITGELVANALEHSMSHVITVTCALAAEAATVGVTDEGKGRTPATLISAMPPGPEQERGRGLLITEALAARWGTRRAGDGLTVWAEVVTGGSKGAAV